jgi:hypothetical protein
MTTKSDRDIFRTLHAETAKAIRRGEKFARSLKRVVAQRNPDTPLQPLLRAVEKGLATLGIEAGELERIGWPKKESEKTAGKSKLFTGAQKSDAKDMAGGRASKTRVKGTSAKQANQPSPHAA